ncbi:MAG TPA: hypothetical protein VF109_08925, partial [Mycobacteriales bacterium]
HVLVPAEQGVELLGPPPAGVEVSVWDPADDPPPQAAEAGFWVPQYLTKDRLDEQVAALPRLEVVQLLTAGADAFVGRIPYGDLDTGRRRPEQLDALLGRHQDMTGGHGRNLARVGLQ